VQVTTDTSSLSDSPTHAGSTQVTGREMAVAMTQVGIWL
jgi:hypothetical protein